MDEFEAVVQFIPPDRVPVRLNCPARSLLWSCLGQPLQPFDSTKWQTDLAFIAEFDEQHIPFKA